MVGAGPEPAAEVITLADKDTFLSLSGPLPVILDQSGTAMMCTMLRGELTSVDEVYVSFNAAGALLDDGWRSIEPGQGHLTIPVGSIGFIRR
jgi:hypothetical protein